MFLDYFALFLVFFVALSLFYGIIVIHDIPYEIAQHRNHPHKDAIHVAGWVSLFTLHVIWPFLWIWAYLYDDKKGWGFSSNNDTANKSFPERQNDNSQKSNQIEESQQIAELTLQVKWLTERINLISSEQEQKETITTHVDHESDSDKLDSQ